ncbi:MAG: type III-B CRISPR module RAMP protein Cmr6 [Bryobacteraceae bacterium]|nr:type III-B CRISPR module RAMP protein Cmr6 [Bryobacteraceae bacterium]
MIDRANRRSGEAQQLRQALGPNNQNLPRVVEQWVRQGELPSLWTKNDHAGREAWESVCRLEQGDRARMQAIVGRMQAIARAIPGAQVWHCEAEAVSPFTTGLGNEHPLENGFSFLNPYGLPYLPGSGVKGVVREAARQLSEGQWEDSRGWDRESVGRFTVRQEGEEKEVALTALEVLFGRETPEGESDHFRGVLSFWDVVPRIEANALRVEVMTPHQSHYYQQKPDAKSGGSATPHDCGQPKPILFLTVPPGAKFHFVVTCDTARLRRVAPALLEQDRWKALLDGAFQHAFDWLGFGAKTAVGYGAMKRTAREQRSQENKTPASAGQPAGARPPAVSSEELIWEKATLRWNAGKRELSALASDGRSVALASQKAADEILQRLSEEQRQELQGKKKPLPGCRVRVLKDGNKFQLLGLED